MTDLEILQGADRTVQEKLTPDEASLKRLQDYYAKVSEAEKKADPLLTQKAARAQQRLAAIQAQRQSFDVANPEFSLAAQAAAAKKRKPGSKKPLLIGGAAIVAGVVGFLAYRRWRKK